MKQKKKLAGVAIVGATVAVIAASAVAASATPQGKEVIGLFIEWGGGATDLSGNTVDTKTFVGDTLPSDLGELEFSGTATPESEANGQVATSSGGAFDLDGNPVESKTYVGDNPPADLGELEFSGEQRVDEE